VRKTRLTRLEQIAQRHSCPECGRAYLARGATRGMPGLARLSAGERGELARLLVAAARRCERCRAAVHHVGRLTDDQKRRTLGLLRILLGRGDGGATP
jgi:hypothetical protein